MKMPLIGALYGTGLAALAYCAAGFGHGTYTILGLVSAPMSFLGILVALISLPFAWMSIFALRQKKLFISAMMLHYSCAVILLTVPLFADRFGDWDRFAATWARSPALLALCFSWYVAGRLFIWIRFAARKVDP